MKKKIIGAKKEVGLFRKNSNKDVQELSSKKSRRKHFKLVDKRSLVEEVDDKNGQMESENPVTINAKSSALKKKRKRKKSLAEKEINKITVEPEDSIETNQNNVAVKKKKKPKKSSIKLEENKLTTDPETVNPVKSNSTVKKKQKVKFLDQEPGNDANMIESEKNEASDLDGNTMMKKKLKKGILVQRFEPAQNISEFSLSEVGKEKVRLDELIQTSQKLAGQVSVKKQLQNAKQLKSLSAPLSKPQFEKIKRKIAYEKVCNEVTKWDTVIQSNRSADQLIFPLKKPEFCLESFESVAERFVSKHPVQIAVSELLKTSDNDFDASKPLTPAEEKALQAMSMEEAKLRHNELMKHRALISYQEAKARRQNKIKSKRYHRILKREKMKKMIKEFEQLQKTDAAAALEKFLETDKLRIMERMTLKHRNTGKWAKQQKLRAKYNPESRSSLKEDLVIGRKLKEKLPVDDSTTAEQPTKVSATYSRLIREPEPDMSLLPNRGLIENNVRNNHVNDVESLFLIGEEAHDFDAEEYTPVVDHSAVPDETRTLQITAQTILQKSSNSEKLEVKSNEKVSKRKLSKPTTVEDDMDFSSEVTCLNSMVPDDVTFGDEGLDDCDETKMTIEQAFADEDFISEFREDKKAAENANRPEKLNLFLPGWGTWGGPGVKISRKRKQRYIIKPVETIPKKNTLGNVIINEDKDKKASVHQVRHLPFPFTNVHQFESYIRQPIGHTWNPQSSFQNLVAPKIITKMGKIIQPIDAEDAVLENKSKEVVVKKKRQKTRQLTAF